MEQQINFVTHLGARCFIYFEGNIVILVHFIFIAVVSQELFADILLKLIHDLNYWAYLQQWKKLYILDYAFINAGERTDSFLQDFC